MKTNIDNAQVEDDMKQIKSVFYYPDTRIIVGFRVL